MNTRNRISQLENEIESLKSDLQAVVLGLRGKYRNAGSPLNTPASQATDRQISAGEGQPDKEPQTAREEVTRARQPSRELYFIERPGTHGPGQEMDTGTIAGLAQWAEESTRNLGKERTEAVLAIAEIMGYLPPDVKRILFNLVNAEPGGNAGNIAARDYLDLLVRIRDKRRETFTRLLGVPDSPQKPASTGVLAMSSLQG